MRTLKERCNGPRLLAVALILLAVLPKHAYAQRVMHTTGWLDSVQTKAFLQKMNKNSLFPCRIESRVQSGELRYKADYCYFLSGMDYFYSHWGVADDLFKRYSEFYESRSMHPYYHSEIVDAQGDTRHQVTFVRMKNKQEDE